MTPTERKALEKRIQNYIDRAWFAGVQHQSDSEFIGLVADFTEQESRRAVRKFAKEAAKLVTSDKRGYVCAQHAHELIGKILALSRRRKK